MHYPWTGAKGGGLPEGRGGPRQRGAKGENWDNCNSLINKIYLKNYPLWWEHIILVVYVFYVCLTRMLIADINKDKDLVSFRTVPDTCRCSINKYE